MTNNNVLKGVFLVGLGATSYGMLATFVKMAYGEGYTTAEVTSSQFVFGIIGILLINAFQRNRNKNTAVKATKKKQNTINACRNFNWFNEYFLLFGCKI